MIYVVLVFILGLYTFIIGENCHKTQCSNVIDYVCGSAEFRNGIRIIGTFHNICHLNRMKCRLKYILDIEQVHHTFCNLKRTTRTSGRRVYDFSIVGAHQACNHTCPTYCIDTYEPACAQIWKSNMKSYNYRPMINHCHIDLFSCALGVNVTIQPLGKCYKNPSGLLFMSQIAALKSLRLIDDTSPNLRTDKFPSSVIKRRRLEEHEEY
ncbi:uncharacterized protein LOC116413671 [Galleria mellonella]|uniref:Uncharacterized protein LOC116413671 n=1 Tax=Galleria mellonella TaxID=7137 RepID=A0A6J3CC92_GALME|nr:uncharacterized protein LOC116413671 [Galleria mellonella]